MASTTLQQTPASHVVDEVAGAEAAEMASVVDEETASVAVDGVAVASKVASVASAVKDADVGVDVARDFEAIAVALGETAVLEVLAAVLAATSMPPTRAPSQPSAGLRHPTPTSPGSTVRQASNLSTTDGHDATTQNWTTFSTASTARVLRRR